MTAIALRSSLTSTPETVQHYAMAAEDKYWEGLELILSERFGAGIYLMGYTAETILKHAYFRLIGSRPVDAPNLAGARQRARIETLSTPHENYHSVLFWGELVRAVHASTGRCWSPAFAAEFMRRVQGVYQVWWIEMRYRPDIATIDEAQQLLDDVSWLRTNHPNLWR